MLTVVEGKKPQGSNKYGSSLTLALYTLATLLAAEARFSAVHAITVSKRSNLLTVFTKPSD
jgi:hypothetical protein